MAPLDTGRLTQHLRLVEAGVGASGPVPEAYDTLGAYLRAVREHRGLTQAEVATATRIRRVYLAAIEDRDRSVLPSRPFAIGYVRAYARALGLDGELAVQRFKIDWPETDEPLRNPVGVEGERRRRSPALTIAAVALVVAVAAWNIVQRTLVNDEPKAPGLPALAAAAPPPAAPGVFKVGAPVEAPVESTVPAPYVTPGMFPAAEGAAPTPAAPPPPSAALPPPAAVFATKAPIQGAPGGPVVLQARRSVALIVRTPDRSIYFARQLAPGEAFRPAIGRALTLDVGDPGAVAVYKNGALAGVLTALQTPLDSLAPAAPAPAPARTVPPPAAPAPATPTAATPTR